MTQISFIREEARNKGSKRTIKLPAILAGEMLQFTRDHDKLKGVISQYGEFNGVTVLNNGAVDVEISLDFAEGKTYPVPAAASVGLDEVTFQGFNIVNLDAVNPTIANKITVTATFERSELREKMRTKKEIFRGSF